MTPREPSLSRLLQELGEIGAEISGWDAGSSCNIGNLASADLPFAVLPSPNCRGGDIKQVSQFGSRESLGIPKATKRVMMVAHASLLPNR